MTTKILLVAWLAMSVLTRPLASEVKQEMCLCEFVTPQYSPIARAAMKVGADGAITVIWPPGTVIAPSGDIGQILPDGIKGIFAGDAVAAVKKWRFCPGAAREFEVAFVFKLTEPGRDGWAPTEVSFHGPATVEISTARNSHIDIGTK